MGFRLASVLLVLGSVPALAAPASRCEGEVAQETIARIDPTGDLTTASGSVLKLADVRLADGAVARLAAVAGEAVAVQVAGGRDRWGRLPARIVLARGGTDLATLLIGEGLALVDVGEADGLCRPGLLASEAEARTAWRGVWGSLLVPAEDPEAVAALAGGFAVVEGRVVGIGERPRWTYVNFGRDFRRDFAVSISRRNWEAMRRAGLTAETLKGRRIRVRGIVEMRRAPGMEITSAEMIERVDEGSRGP